MDLYEAWELPKGIIVVRIVDGDRAQASVVTECITIEEARAEAAARNTESWLADRPDDAPNMEWGDDWEGRLLHILDKPLDIEKVAA